MPERDDFERRLGASIGLLADEVVTAIDAAAIARSVASFEQGRSGWRRLVPRDRASSATPVIRLALPLRIATVSVILVALLAGLAVLAQLVPERPYERLLVGRMTCEEPAWAAGDKGSLALDCPAELSDRRLVGTVWLVVGEPTGMSGASIRAGSIEFRTSGGTWSGAVQVTTAADGFAVGDAALTRGRTAGGLLMDLHLSSADGLAWGLMATVGKAP